MGYWTVTTPATLYGSSIDPSQLGTDAALGTPLASGSLVQAADPPNTVAGFMQVTYNGKSGWVNQANLSAGFLTSNVGLLGISATLLGVWWFFLRR